MFFLVGQQGFYPYLASVRVSQLAQEGSLLRCFIQVFIASWSFILFTSNTNRNISTRCRCCRQIPVL